MGSRKRGRNEMEASEPPQEPSMLKKLRNIWHLANLMQYIYIFGRAVKIDEDLTIEDLEIECLKPDPSSVLSDIGLALLKYVSSHRGLTREIFDEYTRRQYLAKAPQRNPFGEEEEPKRFNNFDITTKLKVLVQLSQWTLINADRMREKMSETKDSEQTQWRIEEIGYDKDDRYYYVLDDNRLYRRTEPPPPPLPKAKLKSNSKKGKAAARASKRKKTTEAEESANDADADTPTPEINALELEDEDDGFGGRKWECVAITLGQYQDFLASIQKSRDPDEKYLYNRITQDVMPVIEKAEESQLRKKQKQERELLNMQKLATAKRSSRLEAKMEREREEREAAEAERKRKADLAAAKQDQDKQKKMEEARESRMMTREQRIKDREYKRILHEEELANLSEENKRVEAGEAKKSERHLKTEMEKKKKELEALQEEDEWFFDCEKCGKHGINIDDGSHSVACEKCNVWQHSACLGFTKEKVEEDNFHFICHTCKRREEDAKRPKIPSLKFHIGSSASPPNQEPKISIPGVNDATKRKSTEESARLPLEKQAKPVRESPVPNSSPNGQNGHYAHAGSTGMHSAVMNGPALSPQGQLPPSIYAGNREGSLLDRRPYSEANRPLPPTSPAEDPPQANGYSPAYNPYTSPNGFTGYVPQLPPNAFQSPYTGNARYNNQQPKNVGWSARYTPPQQPPPSPYSHAYGPPPPQNNPYANSFDRQRPSSSHSTNNVASPMKSGSERPLPQYSPQPFKPQLYQTPQAQNATQQPNQTPYTNGASTHQPLPPTGRLAYSPVKHQSPPAQPSIIGHPSSSPVAQQPPLQNNTPTSPGFSPIKHSPPQPSHELAPGPPAVLPPAPQLNPSGSERNKNGKSNS